MSTLATLSFCCHDKFVDGAYKYCPMCATCCFPFLLDGSSIDELEIEPTSGTSKLYSLPTPTYEQIYVHHPRLEFERRGQIVW